MAIILIGFMGAGKTSVGKLLGKKTEKNFIDLDYEISKRLQMPISEFFVEYGEEKFRETEHELLLEYHQSSGVISTGGGCIETVACRELLKQQTQVIYLQAEFNTLWNRIIDDQLNIRPLAQSNESKDLKRIYQKRLEFYEDCAAHTIATDHLTTEDVVKQILQTIDW